MARSYPVFVWFAISLLSPALRAGDKVSILIRGSLMAQDVFSLRHDPQWVARWPKVSQHVSELVALGKTSSRQLSGCELRTLADLLREDPRSWGHLAIELPADAPDEARRSALPREVYGFHADPPELLPFAHPLRAATSEKDYVDWLRQERPIPASFHRNEKWLNDPSETQPVFHFDILVTDDELQTIRENFRAMQRNPRMQFQLPILRPLGPDCYNCLTAVGELFQGTSIPVSFLTQSFGQINIALAQINQGRPATDGSLCHYRLNRLTNRFLPGRH